MWHGCALKNAGSPLGVSGGRPGKDGDKMQPTLEISSVIVSNHKKLTISLRTDDSQWLLHWVIPPG